MEVFPLSFFLNTAICGFSLYHILAFFLIYSCLGWCLEVVYAAATTGQLVNRGFLNGPVCPIYGFGMILVLFFLTPLEDSLLLLYLAASSCPARWSWWAAGCCISSTAPGGGITAICPSTSEAISASSFRCCGA